jgi:nucleoside-diphosphate-sugar epimerase
MRVTVTGATGLIGRRVVAAREERGDEVTLLSRWPEHAHGVSWLADAAQQHTTSPPAGSHWMSSGCERCLRRVRSRQNFSRR